MEDRRTAIAILLIIMTVMLYSEVVLAPSMRSAPATRAPHTNVSATSAGTNSAGASLTNNTATLGGATASSVLPENGAIGLPEPVQPPTPAELAAAPTLTLETSKYIATFTQLGGRLKSFELKAHRERLGNASLLNLVTPSPQGILPLGVYSGARSDLRTNYQIVKVEPELTASDGRFVLSPGQSISLALQGTLSDGSAVVKTVRAKDDSYLFNVDVSLVSPPLDGTPLWVEWTRYLPDELANDRIDPWTFTALTDAGKIQHIQLPSLSLDGLSQPLSAQWLGLADKYFTATLITDQAGFNARYGRFGPTYTHRVAGALTSGHFSVFVGPKDYQVVSNLGFQLERSIDLGFFSFLAYPLLILIRLFHSFLGNYGLAIVGLTLLIKGLFFPLTRASLRSMKAMQELQPEMQALRERVKDPTQLNQEMLQLYKRKGVNPLGGCLPILLQIPVFFGLYSALQHSIELRHAPFALWIDDLSVPERLTFFGINFPVMIILMGVTMFYQQWKTPMPTVDPAQRRMMLWMSAVFPISFLIFPFPSGLALYMLTNTCISLIQQAYLRNDSHAKPGLATTFASLAIFAVAFVLTLL